LDWTQIITIYKGPLHNLIENHCREQKPKVPDKFYCKHEYFFLLGWVSYVTVSPTWTFLVTYTMLENWELANN
jgi:hypothetical protein